MNKILSPKKMLLLLGFIFSLQTFASFVGDNGSKKPNNDISLKTFSKNSYKNTAYPGFRLSKFQYAGSSNLYQTNPNKSTKGRSFIRMENGNTAYVYPYKYKAKTPIFKAPVAPNTH